MPPAISEIVDGGPTVGRSLEAHPQDDLEVVRVVLDIEHEHW
jgi:hypothetical protein